MAIKTTSIKDVFKQKVADVAEKTALEVYDAPTIWIDSETGDEHEDYDCITISSRDKYDYTWEGDSKSSSYVVPIDSGSEKALIVYGQIKQVGSHVTSCGRIYHSWGYFPSKNNLASIFKYARNLEYANSLFSRLSLSKDFIIPEDIFWNCPKLKEVHHLFRETEVQYIPDKLFAKCPNLESVSNLFFDSSIKEIPEDLFKYNPNITNFALACQKSKIDRIPNKLLERFKGGIEDGTINIYKFADQTPVSSAVIHAPNNQKEEVRAERLPTYFSEEIQNIMLGIQSYF